MKTKIDFHEKEVAWLDLELVTAGLNALGSLTLAAGDDIYTDAPECLESIARVQDAQLKDNDVLERIEAALVRVRPKRDIRHAEALANRKLDEAEEAFAARTKAEEQARLGNQPLPRTVGETLYWIEAEARRQQALVASNAVGSRDQRIYAQALQDLSEELRRLGFESSPAPGKAERPAIQP